MATHRVYYPKGAQNLITVPHKNGAPVRVASATYSILDLRVGESNADHVLVAAGTVASVDAVSTTLTDRAGAGSADHRVLTVQSTAGISAHHSYLLTAADGRAELVRIVAVSSGTGLLAATDIRGQYSTGATLRGVEVTATFPADAADDDDNLDGLPWIIVWQFAGFTPIRESIHLERGEEAQLATLDDLAELDPNIPLLGGNRIDPALALANAHKTFRVHLQLHGANESDLLTAGIGTRAVVLRAAYECYRHLDGDVEKTLAEAYLKDYNEIRAALTTGALKPQVVNVEKTEVTADKRNPAKLFRSNGFPN